MSTATNIANRPQPSNGHIHEVVGSAERELRDLLRQRMEIMRRMGTVKQALVYLAKTFGDDVLSGEVLELLGRGKARKQPGFTRACRTVLMEGRMPLDVRQGYRELARRFPELVERHKDPMASVTTVFNRLVGYGEARSFFNEKGRRVWEWVSDPEQVAGDESADLPARPV